MESYAELRAFDNDAAPSTSFSRPGLESIQDGIYDFEILSAELARTPKTADLILRIGLRVIDHGSQSIEWGVFFRNQISVNILLANLCVLGFDADTWKPPHKPFSAMLPQAVQFLKGMRFRGKKQSAPNQDEPSKPYQNLFVNQKINVATALVPPPAFTPPVVDNDPVPF